MCPESVKKPIIGKHVYLNIYIFISETSHLCKKDSINHYRDPVWPITDHNTMTHSLTKRKWENPPPPKKKPSEIVGDTQGTLRYVNHRYFKVFFPLVVDELVKLIVCDKIWGMNNAAVVALQCAKTQSKKRKPASRPVTHQHDHWQS